MASPPAPFSLRAAPWLLVLLAVLPFAGGLTQPLVYDDMLLVARNASVHAAAESLSGALALFGQEFWHGVDSGSDLLRTEGQALYRPLPLLLWAAAGRVGLLAGGSTLPFHALGLLAHVGVVLLLHRWLRRLGAGEAAALAGAALFAVHPLHAEVAACVAGLPDALATLSVLAGLLCLAGREDGNRWLARLGPGACLFFGLLAKETAILLVPLAVLAELARDRRTPRAPGRAMAFAGLAVALLLHLALRAAALDALAPQRGGVSFLDNPLMFEPAGLRFANGLRLALLPAQLFLWPMRLSADYSFAAWPVAQSALEVSVLLSAAVLAGLGLAGVRSLRSRPLLGWGLLAFVGCALFTSNALWPIGTLFGERLAYLPDVGLCAAVAGGVQQLAARPSAWRAGVAAVALAVVALGLLAVDRTRDFRSSRQLMESAAEARPGSARVHFVLAQLDAAEGRLPEAQAQYLAALRILPSFTQAAVALGDVLVRADELPAALAVYDRLLAALPPGEAGAPLLRVALLERRAVARALAGDAAGAQADLQALVAAVPDPAWPERASEGGEALRLAAGGGREAALARLLGADDPLLRRLGERLSQD